MSEKLLRVGEVTKKYEYTRKRLLYWEGLGLVVPRFIGAHRAYGVRELNRLATIAALAKAGYTPKQLRAIFRLGGVLPRKRPASEDEVTRRLLAKAGERQGALVEFQVQDEREYNTAYKRLRRLASELGLSVEMHKSGEKLRARVARVAKRKTAGGAKSR